MLPKLFVGCQVMIYITSPSQLNHILYDSLDRFGYSPHQTPFWNGVIDIKHCFYLSNFHFSQSLGCYGNYIVKQLIGSIFLATERTAIFQTYFLSYPSLKFQQFCLTVKSSIQLGMGTPSWLLGASSVATCLISRLCIHYVVKTKGTRQRLPTPLGVQYVTGILSETISDILKNSVYVLFFSNFSKFSAKISYLNHFFVRKYEKGNVHNVL